MKRIFIWTLCCWLLVLGGCGSTTNLASESQTLTPTPLPPPPQPSATPISNTPPPSPAIQPANRPFQPEAWQIHWSESGQFILQYPKQAKLYENQVPTVDGVLTPAENTIAVHSVNKGNYILALTYFDLAAGTSLPDFIDTHSQCVD